MNFEQNAANTGQVLRSVEAMIDFGKFAADTLMVDGYDFSIATCEDLQKFRDFAHRVDVRVWFSPSLKGNEP
jgi:hypothetical protein